MTSKSGRLGMTITVRVVFKEEFERGGMLHDLTLARTEARITETSQTALCNQMHSVEQRLSRWLLTFADRSNSEQVKVTQSVVAGMLGVRREGISVAVAALREGCRSKPHARRSPSTTGHA